MFAYTKIMQGIQAVSAAVTDAYFNLVTLLLPGNGTNGAQNNTFLDSSSNNFTITRNGNTTQGTFSPFSQTGWSVNVTSNTGPSALSYGNSTNLALGSGDFCAEAFIYMTSAASGAILDWRTNGGTTANVPVLYVNSSGTPIFEGTGGSVLITGSSSVSLNSWTHIALVRSGTTITIYLNGTSVGTATSNTTNFGIGTFNVNNPQSTAFSFVGYISNVRIVKGSPVYTGAFTPPTSPLTAITNTQLLTCQSNRFVDNSSNAFAITVSGTPSVQAFSPFAPTAAYSATTNGGSGYFDGTGDYLTGPNASGGDFSTGSFTISCWFYPTTLSSGTDYGILSYADGGGWNGWQLLARGTTKDIKFEFLSGSAGVNTITGGTITLNAWNYVVVTRSGSTVNLYVNSTTSAASATNSTAYGVSTSKVIVGADRLSSSAFFGYISSAKLVKQADTPSSIPTAPDTNTTNTSLLLNFTNAGITDATAKNDLETVGNAQISTTQSKFGGSSMYFDSSGDQVKTKAQIAIGSGDYTVEGWVYGTTTSAAYIFDMRETNQYIGAFTVGSTLYVNIGATIDISASTSFSQNTWLHFAIVRSGSATNNTSVYLNGTRVHQRTDTTNYSTNPTIYVGNDNTNSYSWNGYIDDFRITKGYARYSGSTYTVPTAAFALQ